jgi:hypothetical protein
MVGAEGPDDALDSSITNDGKDVDVSTSWGVSFKQEDDEMEEEANALVDDDPCCWRFDDEGPPLSDCHLFVGLSSSMLVDGVDGIEDRTYKYCCEEKARDV